MSFKVERRDRVVLSGPNGAGTTTLLRALVGETSRQGGDLAFQSKLWAESARRYKWSPLRLELARRQDAELRAGEPEEGPVAVLEQEIDNLRAAVDFGLATGDAELVREMTATLPMYWIVRGRYAEGRSWLERALALDDVEDETRRRLLSALGSIAYAQADHGPAVAASDEAAGLAGRLGGATDRLDLLREQALAARRKGDLESAERLFREGSRSPAQLTTALRRPRAA